MSSFFIDVHPQYQAGLDFRRVKAEGNVAAICKISEGTSFVPPRLGAYFEQIEIAGLLAGAYHFLTGASGDAQAAHFVRTLNAIGGAAGRLIAADFETNEPDPSNTATNAVLRDFVRGVKNRLDNHEVLGYSGYGFWQGGTPSGAASSYGIDATWDARYADMAKHNDPKAYWKEIRNWYWSQPKWGSKRPSACQFTSAGLVAGQYVDVNRFFGARDELDALAA